VKHFFLQLPRKNKYLLMLSVDFCFFMVAAIFISSFLFGTRLVFSDYFIIGLASGSISLLIFRWQGIYSAIVRYVGADFFHRANIATILSTALIALLATALKIEDPQFQWTLIDPFKWGIFFWALTFTYVCYSRYLSKSYLTLGKPLTNRKKVIIYGAGSAASQLVNSLAAGRMIQPVAMIDDDESIHGSVVNGVRVYPPTEIEAIAKDQDITKILLAIPSASHRRRQQILESLEESPIHVQTIPDIRDLISGKARVDDLREVDLADLMGRPQVPPNSELLNACIANKTVLVTGAGGSIGSELCRQILRLDVRKLLLLDISEASLYQIDKELRGALDENGLQCELIPLLGSVCDRHRIDEILGAYNIQTIYHAAAYKHVPMVEHNIIDGVRNNALGTFNLAQAACDAHVETFVLVSTDKAVRPTNVMGASKRIAELGLQALQSKCKDTRFCMVRFGNVLESSGSVIPLFRDQIRKGGPLTITHIEILRYFMTIQEAAELVIQAGSMAEGGDVFVLDMGEPVKILDLAKRLIKLTGMSVRNEQNPDGDIEISITGLRPGEKLYEELLVGEDVLGTTHPRIMRAIDQFIPFGEFEKSIGQLSAALGKHDCDATRRILLELVDCYTPTNEIDDLIWNRKEQIQPRLVLNKVTKTATHKSNVIPIKEGRNTAKELR
jgi:FlaA1/EpsC-like NDP-sugar epimerase